MLPVRRGKALGLGSRGQERPPAGVERAGTPFVVGCRAAKRMTRGAGGEPHAAQGCNPVSAPFSLCSAGRLALCSKIYPDDVQHFFGEVGKLLYNLGPTIQNSSRAAKMIRNR